LLLFAKHLFVAAMVAIAAAGGSRMSNGTASALNSEQDLASIPMAQGGSGPAGDRAPQKHWRAGGASSVTPELIAEPEERLNVHSKTPIQMRAAGASSGFGDLPGRAGALATN
jgi:hypothetical protein